MEENYGLRAMELYRELYERVNNLEAELNRAVSTEIIYDDYMKILGSPVLKDYLISAKTPCRIKVKMTVKNLTGKFKIEVYLNGVKKNEASFNADTDEYFDELPLKKGLNSLRVNYVQVGDDYCFFTPTLTVEGAVKAAVDPKRVSVTESAGSFGKNYNFTYISGEILEYHSFSGEGGDNVGFIIDGVKSAALVTFNGINYIFYLTVNGRLKCVKPTGSSYEDVDIPEIYGADIAGYALDSGTRLFLVKFGDVFVADFNGTASLNFIKSGIKARKVYAENNVKCLIAASDGLPSRLIASDRFPISDGGYSSVKLLKGGNYHIYSVSGGYDIVYSENGVVKKLTVKSGVLSDPVTLTVGDEIIKTDSAALIRSGQNLKEAINYKFKL